MTASLYRLAYCSRNVVPDADFAPEMQRILEVSRRNNQRAGVTGALLFNRGWFGQVLEGEYPAVESTFESVQNDERHADVIVLQFEAAPERGFGPWAMAHVGAEPTLSDAFAGMAAAAEFDPSRCSGAELFKTLHGILVAEERGRTTV